MECRRHRSLVISCLIGGSLVTNACAGVDDGSQESDQRFDRVAQVNQPILHGTQLSSDPFGMVRIRTSLGIYGTGICSGAILGDNWVLTARHCLINSFTNSDATLANSEFTVYQGVNTTGGAHPDAAYVHPYADIALLHMGTAMMNPATGGSYRLGIFWGSNDSLAPGPDGVTRVRCLGYGTSDEGTETLHAGYFKISGTVRVPISMGECPYNWCTGYGYKIARTDASQPLPFTGDSGGPCLMYQGNGGGWGPENALTITGVIQGGSSSDASTVTTSYVIGAQVFRDWVYATMGAANSAFLGASYAGTARVFLPADYDYPLLFPQDEYGTLSPADDAISSIKIATHAGRGMIGYRDYVNTSPYVDFASSSATLSSTWDNAISSVFSGDWVVFYQDSYFGGQSWHAWVGANSLVNTGADLAISSLHVPPGWRVKLYTDATYGRSGGRTVTYYGGDYAYVGNDDNDLFRSFWVEEPAVVYVDSPRAPDSSGAHFQTGSGPFAYLWPGWYTMGEMGIPNDSLSAMRLPSGWFATLYWDESFGGPQKRLVNAAHSSGPEARVFDVGPDPDGWNDATSSIYIGKSPLP